VEQINNIGGVRVVSGVGQTVEGWCGWIDIYVKGLDEPISLVKGADTEEEAETERKWLITAMYQLLDNWEN
jgi:hypothetical protein